MVLAACSFATTNFSPSQPTVPESPLQGSSWAPPKPHLPDNAFMILKAQLSKNTTLSRENFSKRNLDDPWILANCTIVRTLVKKYSGCGTHPNQIRSINITTREIGLSSKAC
ncbi:predicted protein [Histoplasma mississippiense (nom. inval.)]|uniref:predicted protein n=1 Tax=Ajellomyces capsulatus (strain NAm1 / WU24) TaxID=2059318 RepID=UPI000157B60E|nr:predicted protein [Histoplasma mississippiense (nom. inval.)]EDN02898.1 predicted protein [Histoplasma mississippiense (nom. inval.)]